MAQSKTSQTIYIALVVSLGGFLFGFDASVISGVIKFIVPEFSLDEIALGWAVASLTLTSTIAMLTSGPLSDKTGRKKLLIAAAALYSVSAFFSAVAPTYWILVVARMVGGFAVGASLILAPMYIAEIAPAQRRGQMVSINQLNIVLGFSAAYFSNYLILGWSDSGLDWVQSIGMDTMTWRWMLGLELIPALAYFFLLFRLPESPRWLIMQGREEEAVSTFSRVLDEESARQEVDAIKHFLSDQSGEHTGGLRDLFKPAMRLVLTIGVIAGVMQQITGVNAVFFYAPTIFEQSGIGSDAAFSQAVWVGVINVIFTIMAMAMIDKLGRRPLMIIGCVGVALSMTLAGVGFSQATYKLDASDINSVPQELESAKLQALVGQSYDSDVDFKNALKDALGENDAAQYQAELIALAVHMNPILILVGILGFVASFAFSLGPVMWVLFSELFPNWIRGVAISFVGFVNSIVSFLVQFIFPYELATIGNAGTFFIFGGLAAVGLMLLLWLMPETKGRSLEELEKELIKP